MTSILSQIQARSVTISDFDTSDIFSQTAKERITAFQEDPLVLACVLKAYTTEGKGYLSLDSESLLGLVTDQDRSLAENIREYYTKKFFWRALSDNRSLSDYRLRLLNLLENRVRQCKDTDCGIYYKLPYFYEEDMVYDEFKKNYTVTDVPSIRYGLNASKETLELVFLKSTSSNQRKRKIERFWFTDQQYLYQIEIDQANPLLDMFKHFLHQDSTVKLQTFRDLSRIDNLYYYRLYKFNFVKE